MLNAVAIVREVRKFPISRHFPSCTVSRSDNTQQIIRVGMVLKWFNYKWFLQMVIFLRGDKRTQTMTKYVDVHWKKYF